MYKPSLVTTASLLVLSLSMPQTVLADDDAKIQARIETWGKACKNRAAEQFDVSMSEIHVSLGATLQTSIDAGEMTLQDIQEYGLSYNWEVEFGGKTANGYCNTDGEGVVTEFKQQ